MIRFLPPSQLVSGLLLAFAYAFSGYLGLKLAIPPGYATAIFPPTGIALAVLLTRGPQLVWGVILGSFSMNCLAGPEHPWLAATIGCGAGLQAYLGYWLIHRRLASPIRLDEETAIIRFQLLGGPIACLVGASIGICALVHWGLLNPTDWLESWLTWWVGDTLGVLVLAPLCFIVLGQPRSLWLPRIFSLGIPLIVCSILVLLAFLQVSRWESVRLHTDFSNQGRYFHYHLSQQLNQRRDLLLRLQLQLNREITVTETEFHQLSGPILSQNRDIDAIGWLEPVAHSLPTTPLVNTPNLTQTKSRILLRFANSQPAQAQLSLGVNFANQPELQSALQRSEQHNDIDLSIWPASLTGSSPIQYLMLLAVYRANHQLQGYLFALITPQHLLNSMLESGELQQQQLILTDVTDPASVHSLFRSSTQTPSADTLEMSLGLATRQFQLQLWADKSYWLKHRSWQSWSVLAGGMCLSALLGSLLLLASGRTARIQQLVRDQTEVLYRNQQQIKQHNQQLQHSKTRLRSILQNLPDILLILDQAGLIQDINATGEHLLGYHLEELIGKNLQLLLPELAQLTPTEFSQYNYVEVKARCRDQRNLAFELCINRLNSEPEEWIVSLHDLTERHKVERLKDEFLSVVSHELRTPLTSIQGSLGLLTSGALGAFSGPIKQLLDIATSNAQRLTRLINDLLDINKLEQGGLSIQCQTQLLQPLLDEALTSNQGYASRYQVKLQAEWQIEPQVQLNIAADRFIQILNNLISNAIKFSQTEAVVRIRAYSQQQQVRIEVIDQGAGIPEEFKPKVFDKFTQANSSASRNHEGSGLGLAITRQLTLAMNGKLGFSSQLGQGSCFWLEFPMAS